MTKVSDLAINGGPPVRDTDLPQWPRFAKDEISTAVEVLESGDVNQWTGDHVRDFEQAFADYVGADHAVALANGTLALELAYRALGIGPGDEVVVPSRTFVATASAAQRVGATPVVADIDPRQGNATAATFRDQVIEDTAAIVPVHVAGNPCDMGPILDLADDENLHVVEDCAQAHGATYDGEQVGTLGDVGCFSFCQDKILTTGGEGGMIVTEDEDLYRRAWEHKDHGKDMEKALSDEDTGTGFQFVHDSFGTNYRLTGLQAAIGSAQLDNLDDWLEQRERNARVLEAVFEERPSLRPVEVPDRGGRVYYKLHACIDMDRLADVWDRPRVQEAVAAEGVYCAQGICGEIYREKAFDEAGRRPDGRFPGAREVHESSLMFLVHPTMDTSDIQDVAEALEKVLDVAEA